MGDFGVDENRFTSEKLLKAVSILATKSKKLNPSRFRTLAMSRLLYLGLQATVNAVQYVLAHFLTKPFSLSPNPAGLLVCLGDVALIIGILFEGKLNISTGRKTFKVLLFLKRVVWLVFLILIIMKVVVLGEGTISDPFNVGNKTLQDHERLTFAQRSAYMGITIVSLFIDCGALAVLWSFSFSFAPIVFTFSLLVNLVLGVSEIQLVTSSIIRFSSKISLRLETFYMFVAAFTFASAILGLCVVLTMTQSNRFSPLFRNIVLFLQLYFMILLIFTAVAFGTSVYLSEKEGVQLYKAVPIMVGVCMFMDITILWSSTKLSLNIPQELVCEAVDIKSLKPYQKSAYAKLISSNPKNNPGISGEEVLSLMETYAEANLNNLTCTVLRIYNPRKSDNFSSSDKKEKLEEKLYEKDGDNFFFDQIKDDHSSEVLENLKPMSKNQRKRAKKKKKNIDFPVNDEFTEEDFEEEARFYSQLKSTEALALFSLVEEYDVSSAIPGRLGSILSSLFGERSLTKFLCIKVGLLAFHWPFRHSVFYCCSSKNPGLRNALVMKSIAKYNSQQKKRCTIIIDPLYSSAITDSSIYFSKWTGIKLPSTNLIDLRPYKKKSPHAFFKSMKYRIQFDSFKNVGGDVYEVKESSESACIKAIDLWSNIAINRKEGGFNGYFASPDTHFFEALLSYDNDHHKRSLLFLKAEDTVIASCFIFRLGETITSDLQGLDYEKSRKYKAYFVMMEAVVNIAMNEGVSFVDFGPSTDEAKRSIGSSSVNITGGLYTAIPFLSGIVKFAAKRVNI